MSFSLRFVPALIISAFFIFTPTTSQAEEINLHLKIERYTPIVGEINVRTYIKNAEAYKGYRLSAIEVVAGALNESASTSVYVNGMQQGQSLPLGQETLNYFILLETDFFMGQGAEDIKLLITNPAYIKTVNLILTR